AFVESRSRRPDRAPSTGSSGVRARSPPACNDGAQIPLAVSHRAPWLHRPARAFALQAPDSETRGVRAAARSTTRGCSLPRWRNISARVVRTAWLYGRSDAPQTRREHAGPSPEQTVYYHAPLDAPLDGPADARVRAGSLHQKLWNRRAAEK